MARLASFVVLAVALISSTTAFPAHRSLAGLSRAELDDIIPQLKAVMPQAPPPPLVDNGTKLVNDAEHPWMPLTPDDKRGPCPGLNTLASHGWLPRNGVATPAQLINAAQEGFNFENQITRRFAYSSHLIDGNLVTDLLSIGAKSDETGPNPPAPANPGGLNLHGFIEGDASMTRADAYFGDNYHFNETQFDQLLEYMDQYGGGFYNYKVAGEFRYKRIQDSIATNPNFTFTGGRYFAAYIETVVGANLFSDGRRNDSQVSKDAARSFFQDSRMPDDFHRAAKPYGTEGVEVVIGAHKWLPGSNANGVNTYTIDETSPTFETDPDGCQQYELFVTQAVVPLYPNPTGVLKRNLKLNLKYYYDTFGGKCQQLFPYGEGMDNDENDDGYGNQNGTANGCN